MKLKIKKLDEKAIIPQYQSEEASGLDLHVLLDEKFKIFLNPDTRTRIHTGIAVEIEKGYEGQVRPRSGLATKHGVTIVNSPGTIDSDYRGEIIVYLINHGRKTIVLGQGDRIAQLVITPVIKADIEVVDELSSTTRGSGGFGSTGK